jgi:hypothetical protein
MTVDLRAMSQLLSMQTMTTAGAINGIAQEKKRGLPPS